MADLQHPDAPQEAAHTAFRYVSANQAAVTTAEANDHTNPDEGLLMLQSDIKRIRYLSASGNPGTWSTLYPGYTVTAGAPTVDDDVDAGYEAGHIWVDTSGSAIYMCLDATDGAADWNQIDSAGGGSIGSGTDNRLARYNGTSAVQQSGITVDDSDNLTGIGSLSISGSITIDAGASDPSVRAGTADPSAGAGVAANEGSIYLRYVSTDGEIWLKTGAADTAWTEIVTGGSGSVGTGVDNRMARYNGTGAIQDSGITVDDSDNVSGVVDLTMTGNVYLSAFKKIGINESSPAAAIDVVATAGAQMRMASTAADATNKQFYLSTRHYTNAEQDLAIFTAVSQAASSTLSFGGATSLFNSATTIDFYTAANTTTLGNVANKVMSCRTTAQVAIIDGDVTNPGLSWISDLNTGFRRAASDSVRGVAGGVDAFGYDDSIAAGNTRLLVYDVDNAAMERVSVGAADSGGAGYKVLRIPN